ncbi:MAG: DUF378 domain-containing protein [Cyanobacteria bacterium SIG31]|nr:DUF378 domain-containing protein [Cyanobacteria bacterium SIG31]
MNILRYTAYILTLIGALNWGLVGLFGFDLIAAIFGEMTLMSRILYTTVGISAIVTALTVHHCDTFQTRECDEYGNCRIQ